METCKINFPDLCVERRLIIGDTAKHSNRRLERLVYIARLFFRHQDCEILWDIMIRGSRPHCQVHDYQFYQTLPWAYESLLNERKMCLKAVLKIFVVYHCSVYGNIPIRNRVDPNGTSCTLFTGPHSSSPQSMGETGTGCGDDEYFGSIVQLGSSRASA